jgi:eukaryotic-like serine/threonine-protein kinase
MSDFEPKQFGKYLLLKKIAVGGMAEIYRAKTYGVDGFEKELAIKRILPHCSADKDFVDMLVDEAKLSVLLSHANIVQVYDLGKVGDDYYISMEFINGVNLRDITYRCRENKTPLPPEIAVYIGSEICKGLDYAHRKTSSQNEPLGIVHRDISPQNILISFEGEVKVGDFGIAKAAMNISHTMAGILKGKIAYMSPEQAMGKAVDSRTDIFSTGILLYEMLTGKKLFTGESQFEVLKKIRTTHITAEDLPDSVPEALKPVLAKTLAYEVDDRIQHAGDLQIELTKYLYSTYVDFTPRKLAKFVNKTFEEELKTDQQDHARESNLNQVTSSVNIREGAKQEDIVHRESSFPGMEGTARTAGPQESFVETKISSGGGFIEEAPTESKTMRKKKRWGFLKPLTAIVILAASAWAVNKYAPQARFWEKAPPPPPAVENIQLGSVEITSEPSGAELSIDGKGTDKKSPTTFYSFEVGKTYKVKAEKKGFTSDEKTVYVASKKLIKVRLSLAKPMGVLNLISDPSSAAIMLNGKLTGLSTPATLEKLPIDKDIRITFSKPEYEDFEQVLTLTSSKPQKISAKLKPIVPQQGTLVLKSTPSGASVVLNGKDTGRTTPATIANLTPGEHTVTLSIKGYKEWKKDVVIVAQQSVPVEANLAQASVTPTPTPSTRIKPPKTKTSEKSEVAKKGNLSVTSKPSGAKIYLNGKSMGKSTPATLTNLTVGRTYKVRLDMNGYRSAYRNKAMKKTSEKLYATLKKKEAAVSKPTPTPAPTRPVVTSGSPGKIKVKSNPSGADVFINSEHRGTTPLTVSVPAGSARVIVSKQGQSRHSRTVTVKSGKTLNMGTITLGGLYGEVNLSSNPPRATVIFDGQQIPAKTPVTVRRVRTDRSHSVTVQLPGYRSWSRTFSMDGNKKTFNVNLQPN